MSLTGCILQGSKILASAQMKMGIYAYKDTGLLNSEALKYISP